MTRLVKLGRGFSVKGDKITDHRHKLGSVSQKIANRKKAKRGKIVTRARASLAMKVNRP